MALLGRWSRKGGLDAAHGEFLTMLQEARQALEVALAARLGDADVMQSCATVSELEERGDAAEMRLRRLLLVHASTHGASDIPACLTYMSIGKDAERISDLALGLCQIAERIGPPPPPARADLALLGQTVLSVLEQVANVLAADDDEGARALIKEARGVQQACTARLDDVVRHESGDDVPVAQVIGAGGGARDGAADDGAEDPQPVALALTYRHLGRIAANTLNIASSVVVPLDHLDYPASLE
jgi:phosphate uptake regulator